MPKYQKLSPDVLERLPKRTLGRRDLRTLEMYRSYIRDMLSSSDTSVSALELSGDDAKRPETVKRWLRRAASEEGIRISVHKRGKYLVFEESK